MLERVRRVIGTRADSDASADAMKSALVGVRELRSFLDASEAHLARRLAAKVSCPEAAVAESSKASLNAASRTMDRVRTLSATPGLAEALDSAAVTAGHVDAVTRAAQRLEPDQRAELYARVDQLVDIAAVATVEQFGRRVRTEADRIVTDDGMTRFERQVRNTSLSTWVDNEGMWNLRGKFDPLTGLKLSEKLERAVEALFAESTPTSCPSDPIAKQAHLRALALARLVDGTAGTGRASRPEFVAVIDVAAGPDDVGICEHSGAGGGPVASWPIPIEVPTRILADLVANADVVPVVVRNGVVLHAPGALNLGRTTRLANRAQRRALRALYRTCAIPGCTTGYDRCKLHHIIWWRHGGRTDLDNLVPVCSHHHHKIHDHGWNITLGPNRQLTVTFPDGTIHNTGPPNRRAA